MTDYEYKTRPFDHQRTTFEATRDLEAYALWWDPGTGKSKTLLDTSAYLYERGKIGALVVVAPPGVHRNWAETEVPKHVPDRVRPIAHFYEAKRAKTKAHERACREIANYEGGLPILAFSYDGFCTTQGRDLARKIIKRRPSMLVADESKRIKTPSAKRTKLLIGASKIAAYCRIAEGTPTTNGPFDAYSQVRFLDQEFWKERGFGTFSGFKQHFGIWRRAHTGSGQQFDQLLDYRNLDELEGYLAEIGSRVTKDDVLDLPPRLYSHHVVDLTPEQLRVYEGLKSEFVAWLAEGQVTAPLAIVRLLRLHQVTAGHYQIDGEEEPRDFDPNPRLDALLSILEDLPHKAIIWSRFRRDIDQITAALGARCVRYDGAVGNDDRAAAVRAFQEGEPQFFVANPQAASEGLTLTAARTVVFYTNSFKLSERLQAEARPHRIGQEHPVHYIDLVCPGTVDAHIVKALRRKNDVAARVMGDDLRDWI